jgi:DeoR family transcriptional regulator of aga operon
MTAAVAERRERVLSEIERRGSVTYDDLAERMGVSAMTIRRDIEGLSRSGRVLKTLGGACALGPAGSSLYETTILSRLSLNTREKRAIAECVCDIVPQGVSLFLDGGTTSIEIARVLARTGRDLTVVTNSVMVCMELGRTEGGCTVVGLGGEYDPRSMSFVGPECERVAGGLFVDYAVFSTKGFVPAEGTFESSPGTIRVKQIMAEHCRRVVLAVDHTKLGVRALRPVLERARIATVVTDAGLPETDLQDVRRLYGDVRMAELR